MDARRYTLLLALSLTLLSSGIGFSSPTWAAEEEADTAEVESLADTSATSRQVLDADSTEKLLRQRIDFWISVYTKYSTGEGLIHDAKYPEIVFEKLEFKADPSDFSTPPKVREKRKQNNIKEVKAFYQKLLMSIHKKQNTPEVLNDAEKRVYELYKNINEPNKFYSAAHNKRIRFQLGQKDRFIQGLFYSGRYLDESRIRLAGT